VVDVVQSDRLGAGSVDGELEGGMEGVDDGIVVGAGDVDGVDKGLSEGADDVDGSTVCRDIGMDEESEDVEVKGSQMGFAFSLLDPYVFVFKYTLVESKMKHPFGAS